MRRIPKQLAVMAVVALIGSSVGIGAAFSAASAASWKTTPTLHVKNRSPLTLKALGFQAGERVVIVVSNDGQTFKKRAKAGAAGSFVVRFADVGVGPCDVLSARAVGNLGSLALLKLPKRACLPERAGQSPQRSA